jgi:hypothetical protein
MMHDELSRAGFPWDLRHRHGMHGISRERERSEAFSAPAGLSDFGPTHYTRCPMSPCDSRSVGPNSIGSEKGRLNKCTVDVIDASSIHLAAVIVWRPSKRYLYHWAV